MLSAQAGTNLVVPVENVGNKEVHFELSQLPVQVVDVGARHAVITGSGEVKLDVGEQLPLEVAEGVRVVVFAVFLIVGPPHLEVGRGRLEAPVVVVVFEEAVLFALSDVVVRALEHLIVVVYNAFARIDAVGKQ